MKNIYHSDIYQFNTPVSSYWEDHSSENLNLDKLNKDISSEIVVIFRRRVILSEHLKGKSKKVHDEYLEKRIVGSRSKFNNIKIQPANDIKSLTKKLIEYKNTKKIDKIIKKNKLVKCSIF